MELTSAIQEALVAMLCYDTSPRGAKFVKALIPSIAYDPYYKDIAAAAIRYITEYKEPPGDHTMDLIETLTEKEPKSAKIYKRIFASLQETKSSINREYVLSKATRFCRLQRCKGVMAKAMTVLQEDKEESVDQAESLLGSVSKPIQGVALFDIGIKLNDPRQALDFLNHQEVDEFDTGIIPVDRDHVMPFRGGSHLFLAPTNRGKSWWAVENGVSGVLRRRKVLHVTMEMGKQKVAQRYVQRLFSISKRELKSITKNKFDKDELGRFISMREVVIKNRPHFQQADAYAYLSKKIEKLLGHKPPLIIQQFPSGTLSMDGLRAYLDNLEAVEKFIPDVVIIDYADLMKMDASNLRIDLGRTHVELRGLCQERNFGLINLTQGNRDSYGAKTLNEKNVAEDISKINTADIAFGYNQTAAEKQLGLARLHVLKSRDEEKNQMYLVSQAYEIGQFALDAVRMQSDRYWAAVNAASEEE